MEEEILEIVDDTDKYETDDFRDDENEEIEDTELTYKDNMLLEFFSDDPNTRAACHLYFNDYEKAADYVDRHGCCPESYEVGDIIEVETRNDDLLGLKHEQTGVPYTEDLILLDEEDETLNIGGVFPNFTDFKYDEIQLDNVYELTYEEQLRLAKEQFSEEYPEEDTSEFRFHHGNAPGLIEVVDADAHDGSGHTGVGSFIGKI